MHRNARLTPSGATKSSVAGSRRADPSPMLQTRWACLERRPTNGGTGGSNKAMPACSTAAVGRIGCRQELRRPSKKRSSICGVDTRLGPARIAYRLEMPPPTVHRVLVRRNLNRLSLMDWPTGRVHPSLRTGVSGRARFTSISRSLVASPPAEAGVVTVEARTVTTATARSVTPSSTPPSTTTHVLLTARSWPTSEASHPRASGFVQRPGLLITGSRSAA